MTTTATPRQTSTTPRTLAYSPEIFQVIADGQERAYVDSATANGREITAEQALQMGIITEDNPIIAAVKGEFIGGDDYWGRDRVMAIRGTAEQMEVKLSTEADFRPFNLVSMRLLNPELVEGMTYYATRLNEGMFIDEYPEVSSSGYFMVLRIDRSEGRALVKQLSRSMRDVNSIAPKWISIPSLEEAGYVENVGLESREVFRFEISTSESFDPHELEASDLVARDRSGNPIIVDKTAAEGGMVVFSFNGGVYLSEVSHLMSMASDPTYRFHPFGSLVSEVNRDAGWFTLCSQLVRGDVEGAEELASSGFEGVVLYKASSLVGKSSYPRSVSSDVNVDRIVDDVRLKTNVLHRNFEEMDEAMQELAEEEAWCSEYESSVKPFGFSPRERYQTTDYEVDVDVTFEVDVDDLDTDDLERISGISGIVSGSGEFRVTARRSIRVEDAPTGLDSSELYEIISDNGIDEYIDDRLSVDDFEVVEYTEV